MVTIMKYYTLLGKNAVIMLIVWTMYIPFLKTESNLTKEEAVDYWIKNGQNRLHFEIKRQQDAARNKGKMAKNVILFIGDGMGMSTITATRIYKNQKAGGLGEENELSFEKFPYIGLAKTYEVNYQVPDSAGTATAMLTGVKINANLAGLDARAEYEICDREINKKAKLENLITWAQRAGKYTGFVTTTRVTHATLAAVYAHTNNRYWECDTKVPDEYKDCVKDVARQLVEDEPGRNLRVILGGGLNQLGVPVEQANYTFCTRNDSLNLVEKWKEGRKNYLFVNTTQDLMSADLSKADYLMGIFSPGHLPYVLERDKSPMGHPSLVNMTAQALKLVSKNPEGYVLLIEGGNIDNAHHDGIARAALEETAEMDDAVEYAIRVTNPDDTLIIVTSDHSHTLTISGYPGRGKDILGSSNVMAELRGHDILSYANGPGFEAHKNSDCSKHYWRNVTDEERHGLRYKQFSGWYVDKETHAGEDVPVYSTGPHANLLSGVFEQHYIAHVICYASCIGPHFTYCDAIKNNKETVKHVHHVHGHHRPTVDPKNLSTVPYSSRYLYLCLTVFLLLR